MRSLSVLIKPASSRCTMRCRYCFYSGIANSRQTIDYGIMNLDTLETLVKKCLEAVTESCTFGFQGGEPTLAGLEYYRALINFEEQYNVNSAVINHSLQTNGLTLDAEWAAFLAENRFLTGISLDPDKKVHDFMRPDAAGKDTHNRALAATRILREHNAEFNILSVVTQAVATHPDKTYAYYKKHGFRHIQFIPCLAPLDGDAPASPHVPDAGAYGKFLCRVFDLWHRDLLEGNYVSIRLFDNIIRVLGGYPPENCAMRGRCTPYLLVEGDGTVFPCDFYAFDSHRLGNIYDDAIEDMLTGEAAKRFAEPSLRIDPGCETCEYFFLCRGGCRRERERTTSGELGQNTYCEAFKTFFAYSVHKMRAVSQYFLQ